ncbi:YafY family protein [Shewanella sp. MBTL60-007]|uniref:helix-turn-helix transcriptional regulator n=1 Tax=Shewanella sp. MBTL60-007 TaxID=2815911 RepID=UPI001C7E38D9|nr:WYL domain-containing protein [Shewanella sp. MBTL60-007]
MKEHDTLAKRLGIILTRLNTGEKLRLDELSREFGVSERTLQRDFNERLNTLPIEREGSCYFLDPKVLGRQSSRELSLLLLNIGLDTLFSGKHYLSNGVLNSLKTPPFLFKNPRTEDVSKYAAIFDKLINSIQRRHIIAFTCNGKRYDKFSPYRLVNDRGLWYLAGVNRNSLHSLRVSQISELIRYEDKYTPCNNIEIKLSGVGLDRYQLDTVEVLVVINQHALDAILKENTSNELVVLKELESGDVLASYQSNNIQALLRHIKAWLPDVEVLSPDWVRHQLKQELQSYVDSTY